MLLRNLLGFAAGPIATAALGLIMVPVISWFFLPEDIGRLSIYQITVSFALLFSMLGLDQAYVREYHETRDKATLLTTCFAPGFALLFLIGLLSLFAARDISHVLYGLEDRRLYIITLMAVFASFGSRFLSLILRMQERGAAFSMSQILPKLLQLILIGGLATSTFERSFLELQSVAFASVLLVLLVYSWNTRKQWRPALARRPPGTEFRKLLGFGVPLLFSGLAYFALTATSTLSLRVLSGFSELAIYSVATSFAGAAAVFQSVFSVVWAPMVYKWVKSGVDMRRIDDVARQAVAAVCAIAVACGSLAWLTDLLLPAQYAEVKFLLVCCTVQPLLYTLSEITSMGIYVTRRTKLAVWSALGAVVVNLGLCLALVPSYGAAGAVVANASAFLAFFVARTEASARVWRTFPRRRMYAIVLTLFGLSVITVLFGRRLPFSFSLLWGILFVPLGWYFRTEWRDALDFFYRRSEA